MYGWARHDTMGNFSSVATVTEGTVDATYFVVDRPRPDGTGYYKMIERLAERTFQYGTEDAWCVDSGISSFINTPNANLSIFNPDAQGLVTVFASVAVFSSDMVGWRLRAAGGELEITQFINTQVLKGNVVQAFTDLIPDDPSDRVDIQLAGTWSIDRPFTKVFGLDHLEGQKVSALADGGVVNGLVVVGGGVELPFPTTRLIVGLSFQAQLQTMPLDIGQETNTIQGKRKKVGALTVRVKDSRGVKAGRTFDTLVPIKEMNQTVVLGQNIPLITGDERIVMDPLWDVPGQICLQVDDPVPATVLGVVPEVVVGDTVK